MEKGVDPDLAPGHHEDVVDLPNVLAVKPLGEMIEIVGGHVTGLLLELGEKVAEREEAAEIEAAETGAGIAVILQVDILILTRVLEILQVIGNLESAVELRVGPHQGEGMTLILFQNLLFINLWFNLELLITFTIWF